MRKRKEVKKQKDLTQEIKILKEKYLRSLADYQNLEKRVQKDRKQEAKFAARNIILKILPLLDILEKISTQIKDESIMLLIKKFRDILHSEKVEKIKVLGKKFDPFTMECVEVVEGDDDDLVVEEIRKGYTMFDKILRVSQVKVSKNKKNNKN